MPDNVIRILVILSEIYWVGTIVSSIVQRGLPTSPVFWVGAAFEAVLGFLTYRAYEQYLTNKSYKRWNYVILALSVIGIGVPITLYYTFASLKPAGGAWVIHVLTVNSFYLYRVVKKQPIARQDLSSGRFPIAARVLHLVLLASVPIMILIVLLLPAFGYVPALTDDPDLVLIEIVFVIFIIPFLVLGFYLPKIIGLIWKHDKSDILVYFVHSLRISLFETAAVFGLILGILGGTWFACLPLLLLAGAAMVYSFPTARRWEEWKGGHS